MTLTLTEALNPNTLSYKQSFNVDIKTSFAGMEVEESKRNQYGNPSL